MDSSANEIICLLLCLLSLSSPDYGRYISKRKSTFGDRWGKHVIFRKKRNYFFTWISLQFQFFEMFVVANCVFSCFGRTFHKINFVSGESRQFRRNNLSALHTNSIKWKDMLYSNSRYLVEKNGQFQFPFCSSSSKNIISSEMEAIANLCSVLSLGWRVGTDYKENVEANGWQNDITCSSFSVCIKM